MPVSSHAPQESVFDARGNTVLGAFGAVLALLWVVLVVYCVHPALPYSPVRLPSEGALNTLAWAPQGWAFFTRDPREERQFVFGRGAAGWHPLMRVPHGQLRNGLGLNRKSRAQGVEMALLLHAARAGAWRPCEGSVPACLDQLPRGPAVRNGSPNPTMCGTVAVVLRPPVPWAWLPSRASVEMPSRILPLEVAC